MSFNFRTKSMDGGSVSFSRFFAADADFDDVFQ